MNTNLNMQRMPIDRLKPAKYNPRKDLKPGDPAYEKMKDLFCLVICKCFDHAYSIHAKQVYVNTQIGADTLGDERQEAPAHSPEGTGG